MRPRLRAWFGATEPQQIAAGVQLIRGGHAHPVTTDVKTTLQHAARPKNRTYR